MKVAFALVAFATGGMSHYLFPTMEYLGTSVTTWWSQVRPWTNYYSNGPVTDVTLKDIQCNVDGSTNFVSGILTVAAGNPLTFVSSTAITHPGPGFVYMAKVPSGKTAANWEPSGSVWFKVAQFGAKTFDPLTWELDNAQKITFTIPKNVPSGDYLVRVEHIALHGASTTNGAQFYLSCGQVTVTGGGSGTPSPTVAFPGAYKATDPGILINIYWPIILNYTMPGPAIWTG